MPYMKRIAEIQARIENTIEAIDAARARIAKGAAVRRTHAESVDKLLSSLARLKAQRLRLMQRQMTFDRKAK